MGARVARPGQALTSWGFVHLGSTRRYLRLTGPERKDATISNPTVAPISPVVRDTAKDCCFYLASELRVSGLGWTLNWQVVICIDNVYWTQEVAVAIEPLPQRVPGVRVVRVQDLGIDCGRSYHLYDVQSYVRMPR